MIYVVVHLEEKSTTLFLFSCKICKTPPVVLNVKLYGTPLSLFLSASHLNLQDLFLTKLLWQVSFQNKIHYVVLSFYNLSNHIYLELLLIL